MTPSNRQLIEIYKCNKKTCRWMQVKGIRELGQVRLLREWQMWKSRPVCSCQPTLDLLPESERDCLVPLRTPRFFFLHPSGTMVRF